MKTFLFASLAIMLSAVSCQSPRPNERVGSKNDFTIEPGVRLGPINNATTEEELIALFGAANVQKDSVYYSEDQIVMGTIVFSDSPNAIEIIWSEEGTPSLIRLANTGADWATASGLKVGSSLQELENLNMRPFLFYGFGWDFSGTVTDWKGGRMSPSLMVALEPANMDPLRETQQGEVVLSSDDPGLRPLGITVGALMISFD